MSTLYVVRRERCGCLVSTRPARDQAKPIGESHPHSDGSVSITMPVESAAVVPETCPTCRAAGLHRGKRQAHAVSAEDYLTENREIYECYAAGPGWIGADVPDPPRTVAPESPLGCAAPAAVGIPHSITSSREHAGHTISRE